MKIMAIAAALAVATVSAAQGSELQSQNSSRWNGPYLGAHVGYDWVNASVIDTNGGVIPGPFTYNPNGAFGGATVGYNLQLQALVVGVEADLG
jgi:opacity protein-like surface antigen